MKEVVNYVGFKIAFFLLVLLGAVMFCHAVRPFMVEMFGDFPSAIVLGVAGWYYGKFSRIVLDTIVAHYNK